MTNFVPSEMQANFFNWIAKGKGSAVLIAVAGSGKSTTIVQSLRFIPEQDPVVVLAFNTSIAKEMKAKIELLGVECRRSFANARASTFHSLGYGAVLRKLGVKPYQVKVDGSKLWKLAERLMGGNSAEYEMYGSFCAKLVSLAKGQGMIALCDDESSVWRELIEHHDLTLDSDEADEDEAIEWAQKLLALSNQTAKQDNYLDFDDQIYLPILWHLKLYPQAWVFIDEAQDTNPVRRALAKLALRPGGRLIAVGDPNQAIYGFTGASHDAIDLIKEEFSAIELPLTVSYRCPQAVGKLAAEIVPHFQVHENAPVGSVQHLKLAEAVKLLGPRDAILCRNTKPLVSLAYQLLARDIPCHVLGSEIGKGLVNLVRKMKAKTIPDLEKKLEAYREREVAKYTAKGEEGRAEAITDRVACIEVFISSMVEKGTIAKLIERIEGMFKDATNVLTLSTCHKAKGREWPKVAILKPELMPSPWARQLWQQGQEKNLKYVAYTRAQSDLIFMEGDTLT